MGLIPTPLQSIFIAIFRWLETFRDSEGEILALFEVNGININGPRILPLIFAPQTSQLKKVKEGEICT